MIEAAFIDKVKKGLIGLLNHYNCIFMITSRINWENVLQWFQNHNENYSDVLHC